MNNCVARERRARHLCCVPWDQDEKLDGGTLGTEHGLRSRATEGSTAAFSKARARKILDAPATDTLAGLRDSHRDRQSLCDEEQAASQESHKVSADYEELLLILAPARLAQRVNNR
jgi:hypothetical protein